MSKTKNNKLLIPLITSGRETRLKHFQQSRQLKDNQKKKELLLKAYDNDSQILARHRYRKQSENKAAISFHQKPILNEPASSYRYGREKMDMSEYLQQGKLPDKLGRSYIRRTSRSRPGSLFKIPEKSSVAEIHTKRHKRDHSESHIEMAENHSVDLFKVKQSNQRRHSVHPQTATMSKIRNILGNGRRLYKEGKVDQAEKYFRLILDQDPKHLQALYFMAVISLNNKQFELTFSYLKNILTQKSDYKKSVYLFSCIALKNLQKKEQAIVLASQGLRVYPEYLDLLIYRAKLYQADGMIDLAQKDYNSALVLKDDNAEVYYKKGQCNVLSKEWKKAVTTLTTAIYLDQGFKHRSMQSRARAYLELNNLTEAKKDIEKLISHDPVSSENYELKGILQTREGQIGDAVLSFQQCIKNNTSKASLANALVEITKFKIKDRDFYSAYHHICRSDFLQLVSPSVQMYKLFTEGVIFLMKRKTTQGLANLNKLHHKYPQMDEFLQKLFYLYRAYGYFISSQHEKCLEDYNETEKYQKKDRHAIFNTLIAQGIVQVKQEKFDKAFDYFNKAQTLLPNKVEPYLYRSVNHILMACRVFNEDEIKKLEVVFLALKELDKAYDLNNANSNQLFLRGLVYYYLGKINQGLQDIGRAISKSEQNVPKYFFYRGLGQGTLKNYKQCQNDMTICINLDETFTQAYLQRSKAFFLEGHTQKSTDDIAKYVELNPSADKYFIEGCLYFTNSDFEQATKRFEKAIQSRESMSMCVRCYIIMGEYSKAQSLLSRMNEIHEDEFVADMAIVELMQVLSNSAELQNDKQKYTALNKKTIEQILDTLSQQSKTNSDGIFSELHIYHCLGVCNFYLQRYSKALVEFAKAHKQRQLLNIENDLDYKDIKSILNSEESHNEQLTSNYRQFNEINYNIFLCYLKLGENKKAYQLFIRDIVPAKENVFQNELLAVFSRMIFQTLRNSEVQDRLGNESMANPNSSGLNFEITLFDNVLSSGVPYTSLDMRDNRVRTKLCLLLPNIRGNRMLPEVSSKEIILRINLTEVENKPEPPWVKRSQHENLIFTDDIQSIDNIEFNTQENQQEEQEEGEEEDADQYEQQDQEEQQAEDNGRFDIEKIKRAMKLDDSIEQKLNKLLNKGKKPE